MNGTQPLPNEREHPEPIPRRAARAAGRAPLGLLRKEKPGPGPNPPSRPAPTGWQTPGPSGAAGGVICPGTEGGKSSCASGAAESTLLESPANDVLKRPSQLGGKSIHVTVIEGPDKGAAFDITGIGTYTIGRKECDIVLEDEKVSRKHASIVIARAGQYAVSDLASRNGTYVNGAKLSRRNLAHNDLIRIGNTTLRFTVFDGPVPVEK